LQPRETFITK